jgi:prepilin-type N-terminal cleavage/methylation domain-containing protein
MNRREIGFTLVELMIVVAIIGIVAGEAIPKFGQMLEKSREGATKGNLGSLNSAVANYYSDQQGWYPVTLDTQSYFVAFAGATLPSFCPTYLDPILPGVKAVGKSTWNAPVDQNRGPGANFSSSNAVTTGTWSSPGFLTTSGGYGWKYDAANANNTNGASGAVWVNSEMVDMSKMSYTVYGFQ